MTADETPGPEPSPRRIRPGGRAARVVASVQAATVDLLPARGYGELGIPAIAEAAKVDKTSIYRRWPSKAELVLDVALNRVDMEVPIPDTGNLADDLAMLLRAIAKLLASPFGEGLLDTLIGRGRQGMTLRRARIAFWNARFSTAKQIVEQAIHRREVPAQTDPRQLLELAAAALLFRFLLTTEPITEAEIDVLARRAIAAFRQ